MPNFLKFGIFDIQRSLDFVTAGFSMRPAQSRSCRQARRQSAIDRAANITKFSENRAGKSFFFSQDSKET